MISATASKLLGFAVSRVFPSAVLAGGFADDFRFAYDFFIDQDINDDILALIETEMVILAKEKGFEIKEMMRENCAELFYHLNQPELARIALKQPSNIVSILQDEKMADLFSGDLEFGYYKLLKVKKVKKKTRIIGIAAKDKQALKELEKAGIRDYAEIGEAQELFAFSDEYPEGVLLWLPKGKFIKDQIEKWFHEEHQNQEFTSVQSPRLANLPRSRKKGVGAAVKVVLGDDEFGLIPPNHDLVFSARQRSYRELPQKYHEFFETMSVDDLRGGLFSAIPKSEYLATVYCTEDTVLQEIISSLQFLEKTAKMLNLEHQLTLQVSEIHKEEQFLNWLCEALENTTPSYDEERVSDGSAIVSKALGLKITLKQSEELQYKGADDKMHKPVVLSRSLTGSIERLIASIIEHEDGNIPFWLSLEQIRVIAVKSMQETYAKKVQEKLTHNGFRVQADFRDEPLAHRIHRAEIDKVPFILVVGDQEQKTTTIALRSKGQIEKGLTIEALIEKLKQADR